MDRKKKTKLIDYLNQPVLGFISTEAKPNPSVSKYKGNNPRIQKYRKKNRLKKEEWGYSLFVVIVPFQFENVDRHNILVDIVNHTVVGCNTPRPRNTTTPTQLFGMTKSCFGMV